MTLRRRITGRFFEDKTESRLPSGKTRLCARTILAAMGEMGPTAKPAVPLLLQAMKRNFWVRHQLREALGNIDPEAAAEAGVK